MPISRPESRHGPRPWTIICLIGFLVQGLVLLAAAGDDASRGLAWRAAFVVAALLSALGLTRQLRRGPARGTALAAALLALCLGAGAWQLAPQPDLPPPDAAGDAARTAAAVARLDGLVQRLVSLADEQARKLAGPAVDAPGGAQFRALASLPATWAAQAGHDAPALAAAAWSDGQCVAWTGAVVPLGEPAPGTVEANTSLRGFRGRWYLRRLAPLSGGRWLELQLAVPGPDQAWRGATLSVEPRLAQPDPRIAEFAASGRDDDPLVIVVRPASGGDAGGAWPRPRLMAALLSGWALALALAAWRPGRTAGLLGALWAARALLAAADLARWVVAAFPGVEYPAAPGSWASLVDPAYFATPVAGGWFASTADALLTALLVAGTVWRLPLPGGPVPPGAASPRFRLARTSLAACVGFGALSGLLLPAWRALGMNVAENANARLIGPGVTLGFLTFWGLHLALLLVALAVLGLLVRAGALTRRLVTSPGHCVPLLAVAMTAAAVAGATLGWRPWPGLAAGTFALVLWWASGGAATVSGAARRAAWPVLLLAAALWNYGALKQVHDAAERAWLERRAEQITEADPAWTRFLVQSVLAEMQQADAKAAPAAPAGVWRDEPAWRLYRDSALFDLGYPGLLEVLDPAEVTESLFATGFLRDFRYETLARSPWLTADGAPAGPDDAIVFQSERRLYSGGQEEILVAEVSRRSGRGWLRLETPLRSWRVSTLAAPAGMARPGGGDRYRPRLEVDRPVLMLLADDGGWRGSGDEGFPGAECDSLVAQLRSGRRPWAVLPVGGAEWTCRWTAVPAAEARAPGEGFLLGLRRATTAEALLDMSRLVLVDFVLLAALAALVRAARLRGGLRGARWQPGFQEKFLAGYLVLGLLLLLVVGVSVDRVGYERVRAEAREQAREGLVMALQQVGGLLADEARALADSGGLDRLALDGVVPAEAGLEAVTLFRDDGQLLFDGSGAGLGGSEAAALLQAARSAPVVLVGEGDAVDALVAVPVALGAGRDGGGGGPAGFEPGHGGSANDGVLLYRQRLDGALVAGLADILRGEVTISLDGLPVFASHPEGLFEGERAPLLDPGLMAALFDHPQGPGLASPPGRPFACDAAQPLPAFSRNAEGRLERRLAPAALGVSFPGREREFAAQRRANVLFLAGLANLILLTALLLAALMSWNLFRPLRVLLGATQSLARGDFAAPLPPAGHDEVGRLAGAFGAMRAQLEHAQADLAARERFLATVLERVPVGVAVLAPDGSPVVVNPAGTAILSRFWPDLSGAAAVGRLRDGLQGQAALGSPAPGGALAGELAGDHGRLTLRCAVAPLDAAAPDGDRMFVFEDISEFLATKKLALNAELARQVAHEIKNPLTPIQLSVQLLGQAWNDRHPLLERIVPETVSRVLEQVDLLRRIASEFSLLGRPDDLPVVPLDLPALLARVAAAYAPADDPAGGPLRLPAPPPGLPLVLGHEESLLKILGNLAQNSLDAARPGVAPAIEVAWEAADGRVRLRWRDNGSGVPADVAGRLFEPYFSTKSRGTGLGLAICRSLAERMGGAISLANRPDGPGAEAMLELPEAGSRGQ